MYLTLIRGKGAWIFFIHQRYISWGRVWTGDGMAKAMSRFTRPANGSWGLAAAGLQLHHRGDVRLLLEKCLQKLPLLISTKGSDCILQILNSVESDYHPSRHKLIQNS